MLESDADRLAALQALGSGATLTYLGVSYAVVFDNEYVLAGDVEERAPVVTMLSSDVARAALVKDAVVTVYNPFDCTTKDYRVRRPEPDGTGMTLVILGAA